MSMPRTVGQGAGICRELTLKADDAGVRTSAAPVRVKGSIDVLCLDITWGV